MESTCSSDSASCTSEATPFSLTAVLYTLILVSAPQWCGNDSSQGSLSLWWPWLTFTAHLQNLKVSDVHSCLCTAAAPIALKMRRAVGRRQPCQRRTRLLWRWAQCTHLAPCKLWQLTPVWTTLWRVLVLFGALCCTMDSLSYAEVVCLVLELPVEQPHYSTCSPRCTCSPRQLWHTNPVFLCAGGGAAVEGVRGQAARVWHFEQHIVSLRRVRQHAWAANGGTGTVVSCRWSILSSRLHRAQVSACILPPVDINLVNAHSRLLSTQAGSLAMLGLCTMPVPAARLAWPCCAAYLHS